MLTCLAFCGTSRVTKVTLKRPSALGKEHTFVDSQTVANTTTVN